MNFCVCSTSLSNWNRQGHMCWTRAGCRPCETTITMGYSAERNRIRRRVNRIAPLRLRSDLFTPDVEPRTREKYVGQLRPWVLRTRKSPLDHHVLNLRKIVALFRFSSYVLHPTWASLSFKERKTLATCLVALKEQLRSCFCSVWGFVCVDINRLDYFLNNVFEE